MPDKKDLMRWCIKDLIVDIRSARLAGQKDYENKCLETLSRWFAARHTPKLDRYGYPVN